MTVEIIAMSLLVLITRKQHNKKRGKLLWKRFMEQEPTGKQYSEEKDTRKSKQY